MNSILRRRVHELSELGLSLDQLVDRLRTTFPTYGRYKLRPFTVMVKRILDSIMTPSLSVPLNKKKAKKIDGRRMEPQSESESSEMYSSAVLMHEGEANNGPEVDLTKSMLRNKYNQSSKIDKNSKHLESDAVTNSNDIIKETTKAVDAANNWPRFKDLGGIGTTLHQLKMKALLHLLDPDISRNLRVRPNSGILLHGPPGCGKTTLALAIANETGLPFHKLSAPELVSGISGASEENIRNLFSKAYRTAPSIVFIDEIDAIASKRDNVQKEMEKRVVAQLLICMDEFRGPDSGHVLVIGATNRPDDIDPALRRPGRLDLEIALGVPDENARVQILSLLTRNLKLEEGFDHVKVSRSTPGYVGTDLAALVNEAVNVALEKLIREKGDIEHDEDWWKKKWSPETAKLKTTMADFKAAAKVVQPSFRREGFSSIPNVNWEDIGGLNMLRREFNRHIIRRIEYPNEHVNSGYDVETGFLLYGPPGCGKTLIAKAVAREAGANFIYIQGPELLNKYVGESELAVRTIFNRARACPPCILFFDEVDALMTNRGREGGRASDVVVNQLLVELDGAHQREGVYVIGATNRPDVMDPAFFRNGRFGKLLFVPLPNAGERGMILKALARNKPIAADVDLIALGRREECANLSGADLRGLMNEASMAAADEAFEKLEATGVFETIPINGKHFEQGLARRRRSVSDERIEYYRRLSESLELS